MIRGSMRLRGDWENASSRHCQSENEPSVHVATLRSHYGRADFATLAKPNCLTQNIISEICMLGITVGILVIQRTPSYLRDHGDPKKEMIR